jgi:hypothetical protein
MVKVSIKVKCDKYLGMEGVASFIILFVRVNTGISRMAWFRGLKGDCLFYLLISSSQQLIQQPSKISTR